MTKSRRTNFPVAYLQTISTTQLERQVLDCICFNEMNGGNGTMPYDYSDTGTWSDMILDSAEHSHNVTARQLPGVVSSLVKKGMVWCNGESTMLSPFGYAYFRHIVAERNLFA